MARLRAVDLEKSVPTEQGERRLWRLSFDVLAGEVALVQGPSGSGKTSLLNVLGLLAKPTSGQYLLDGEDVVQAADRRRQALRGKAVTSIFQQGNLLPHLTVLENVVLGGAPLDTAREVIRRVGLERSTDQKAGLLSGGEQQRTAVARALARESLVVLADEPVASLDPANAASVIALLLECAAGGAAVVIASHDPGLASVSTQRVDLGSEVSA